MSFGDAGKQAQDAVPWCLGRKETIALKIWEKRAKKTGKGVP